AGGREGGRERGMEGAAERWAGVSGRAERSGVEHGVSHTPLRLSLALMVHPLPYAHAEERTHTHTHTYKHSDTHTHTHTHTHKTHTQYLWLQNLLKQQHTRGSGMQNPTTAADAVGVLQDLQ